MTLVSLKMGTSGCRVRRERKRKTNGIKNYLNSCCSNFTISKRSSKFEERPAESGTKGSELAFSRRHLLELTRSFLLLLQPDCTITRFLNSVELFAKFLFKKQHNNVLPQNYSLMRGIGSNYFSIFVMDSLLDLSWSVQGSCTYYVINFGGSERPLPPYVIL